MPPPANPMDMLYPGHTDFPFSGWQTEFGPYGYFKVIGYKEVANILAASVGKSKEQIIRHIRDFSGPAMASLPNAWPSVMNTAFWDKLGEKHITGAYGGARRFEKVCLAILCLEQALLSAKIRIDVYKYVKFAPAIYVIDGFSSTFISQLRHHKMQRGVNDTIYDALISQFAFSTPDLAHDGAIEKDGLANRGSLFLDELSKQYAVTLPTATDIQAFLTQCNMAHGLSIRRLNTRNDGKKGKEKKPSGHEFLRFDARPLIAGLPSNLLSTLTSRGYKVS